MLATGASQKLHFPFLFLLLFLLHPNSFAVGQPNIGRKEHEVKWRKQENTWLPKKTKVEVQVEDNTSKDNTWVPLDKTTTGDEEVVEAEVLVLGAGMAGITVAARLKEEGVEGVVVVEGSDRIGGRVKDTQFGGITIELGANWVHRLIWQS